MARALADKDVGRIDVPRRGDALRMREHPPRSVSTRVELSYTCHDSMGGTDWYVKATDIGASLRDREKNRFSLAADVRSYWREKAKSPDLLRTV